jgi:NADPH-dependent curcumin reductase
LPVRQVRLARRPQGVPTEADFALAEVELPLPGDGEVLVRPTHLSLDPYLRLQMANRHLSGDLRPGDVVVSEAVGVVETSRSPDFAAGDTVAGFLGWQERAVAQASALRRVDFGGLPASLALGVLGMPGLTAYAGVTELLKPGPGDTLVVSAAAGPVGATVGQLAKARAARVIGIAGGVDKCRWVTEVAGFDAAIDYKAEDVATALRGIEPDGVSCYFDNVGGELLRTVLGCLRHYGRVALCGIIADYNSDERAPGPLPLEIIGARATVMGLVVYDFEHLRETMLGEHRAMIEAGTLAWREDVTDGLENAPAAFARLMRGENQGKAIVRLDQSSSSA